MRPMPIPTLYRSLHEYLMQRIPDDCESRLSNMIWLMMGIFLGRSLLIAWTWVRSSRGRSTTAKQVKLLAYVNALLPFGVKVSLVGDCEFDHPLLIENLRFWGWDYALRQPGHYLIKARAAKSWR